MSRPGTRSPTKGKAEHAERAGQAYRPLRTNGKQSGQALSKGSLRTCGEVTKEAPQVQEQAYRLLAYGQITGLAGVGTVDAQRGGGTLLSTIAFLSDGRLRAPALTPQPPLPCSLARQIPPMNP